MLLPLRKEWGRSSLALLDVREESRRLSADLLRMDLALAGGGAAVTSRGRPAGSSAGGKGAGPRRGGGEDAPAVEQLLREMEEKVLLPLILSFLRICVGSSREPPWGEG